jgi:hypothetical protein
VKVSKIALYINVRPLLILNKEKEENIMTANRYQQVEATIIGESLRRLLEVGAVRQRRNLKDLMCESLQEAYENTIWSNYIIDVEIPGGPVKSPSQRGVEDPRQPGDEIEEEYEQTNVVVIAQENPRKRELLNEALRWGCEWAQKEHIRMGGKLPLDRKARAKK